MPLFKKRAPRAIARHGRLKVQSKRSAYGGLLIKGLAAILGATLALTAISVIELSSTIKGNALDIPGAKAITAADLNGPINMLIVGSDTRQGQGSGYGNETSNLADVMILLHVSADRKNAVAVSFPRDLLVPWPACPSTSGGPGYLPQALGQLNATIANGGPGCTLLTIEQLTGLDIPYLAMIDFKGVIEMSNAIGGVEVCVAQEINDPYTQTYLQPGKYTLQGKAALQFLRTRHGVGDGSDLARISNQQVFLTSLFRKVKSGGVLTNPVKLYALANAAARNMKLSASLTDLGTLVAMAGSLKDVELDKMVFLQVPSRGGLPAPYSGRVEPVYEQANQLFELLRNDQPILLGTDTGEGAVVATPAPTASGSPSPSPTSTATLDWAKGTNGGQTTCSN
jgi:LCP family protein required for cell wall assembly